MSAEEARFAKLLLEAWRVWFGGRVPGYGAKYSGSGPRPTTPALVPPSASGPVQSQPFTRAPAVDLFLLQAELEAIDLGSLHVCPGAPAQPPFLHLSAPVCAPYACRAFPSFTGITRCYACYSCYTCVAISCFHSTCRQDASLFPIYCFHITHRNLLFPLPHGLSPYCLGPVSQVSFISPPVESPFVQAPTALKFTGGLLRGLTPGAGLSDAAPPSSLNISVWQWMLFWWRR